MTSVTFDYTLRVSPRARVVRLCVSPHKGLEVVVPRGFDRKHLPAVLNRKQAWIERALERVRPQREEWLAAPAWQIPATIEFRAIGMEWTVHARTAPLTRLAIYFHRPGQLEMHGPVENEALVRRVLGRFLIVQAETHLPRLLHAASQKSGLPFSRVSIRRQRSRWGSCSANSAISLNAALLFLPEELTRYVLVHELCHTVHLNHSDRFWALVGRHFSDYRAAERAMRGARDYVPRWARTDEPLLPPGQVDVPQASSRV
jgi:predicted metal-dependent hydrolase